MYKLLCDLYYSGSKKINIDLVDNYEVIDTNEIATSELNKLTKEQVLEEMKLMSAKKLNKSWTRSNGRLIRV